MKKKITLLLAFSIIFPVLIFGQGETSNWYFGNNAGIRFNNNGTVSALDDGRLNTFEGCATISNALGDLLFYTDGIIVYNRNHNVMQNAEGLYGDPSSTQSALIVPKPLDPNIFYIFTVDTSTSENDPDFGLNYSLVDITMNNGNGAVTLKNILYACDENLNDKVLTASFDLMSIAQLNYPNSNISFYTTLQDAASEQLHLPNTIISQPRVVYARIEKFNQCQDVFEIELVVKPSPLVELNEVYELCTDDPFLTINGPDGFDSYLWTRNDGIAPQTISNNQIVSISDIGDYSLEVSYAYNDNLESVTCTNISIFEVVPSNRAVIDKVVVHDFSSNNTVLIEASGDGNYEYSLDGIDYVDSNFFESVAPGIVTIHISDKKGCGVIKQSISVMVYPKFFTPNGDDINDYWSLNGLSKDLRANSTVSIYDRYGTFLAQIEPASKRWDEVLNGKSLPSSDYWVKANLQDGRIFKGHFVLKR